MARLALLVVDVQQDFCPGGSLAVNHGDKVIPRLNRVIAAFQRANLPIFFSRDWHPSDHCSFRDQGGQWPPHCVKGTPGADFHKDLVVPAGSTVVSKATDSRRDSYSAFQGTNLAAQLRRLGVGGILVGGLATDYCVKQSTMDALRDGFEVMVMRDCTRGVNIQRNDSAEALRLMKNSGARIVTSTGAIKGIQRAAMKSSS